MDDEQKPDLSQLKLALAVYNGKADFEEFNRTLNYKEWMKKRTTSQAGPPGFPSRNVQPSLQLPTLPSSSPKPPTQTGGGQLLIKDEPWQGPTELSCYKPLTSAAQDWISPSKEIKLLLPGSSENPNLQNEPPSLRPALPPIPTPTTNTARLQLPNLCPKQDQNPNLQNKPPSLRPAPPPNPTPMANTARLQLPNLTPKQDQNPYLQNKPPSLRPAPPPNPTPTTNTARLQLPNFSPKQDQGLKLLPNTSIPTRPRSSLKRKARDSEEPRKLDTTPYAENGSMMKKSAENLLCHLCQASCSSAHTMQQHLTGRQHKAKMEYMKMKRERAATSTTEGGHGKPRCELCEIWCSDVSALNMHFKGQKHKSKIEELQLSKERGGQKLSKAPIVCELCNVPVMNQDLFEQHLKGRQHAANQEFMNRGYR